MVTTISSPSTLEINARLECILRYTTLCEPSERLHLRASKEQEARSLFHKYHFSPFQSGLSLIEPDSGVKRTGILSAGQIGTVQTVVEQLRPGVLHDHDADLQIAGYPQFHIQPQALTKLDWCTFVCHKDKVGGNIHRYPDDLCDEGDPVRSGGLLYPGARVQKSGRTTLTTEGVVNAVDLIVWGCGLASHEIAIMGIGEANFALKGDSGALVMLKEEGKALRAAGLLHGINQKGDLALATLL